MPLNDAVFCNRMALQSLSPGRTLIIQMMSLAGEKAPELAVGMQMMEKTAPQGLAKPAKTIWAAYAT